MCTAWRDVAPGHFASTHTDTEGDFCKPRSICMGYAIKGLLNETHA